MNAGAYGGEMKDILTAVTVLDQEGNEKILSAEELELGYRTSCILKKGYIVTGAKIKLKHGEETAIRARMDELKEQRTSKQPLDMPSAGSTFKRPEGYFAGKLIINRGNATAADVRTLMQNVADIVEEKFGVRLEPEVKMIGEF